MLAQPSLLLFAAMIIGISTAEHTRVPPPVWAALIAALLALLVWARVRRTGVAMVALAVVAAVGAMRARQVAYPPVTVQTCAPQGGLWQVQVDAPIDRRVQGDDMRLQTTARLLAERCGDTWQPRYGAVRLALRPAPPVSRGDRLVLRLKLFPAGIAHHAFELPPVERLRRQGLTYQARVLSEHALVRPGHGLYAAIDRLRTRGAEAFERGLKPTHAALAKALALGDTGALVPEQRDAWAAAGVAHLLSVSGLHVAMVAMMASVFARFLLGWLPGAGDRYSLRALAAWCALPPGIGFCILTGAHPAAMRATIMAGAALLGIALGYPGITANAWGLAGASMLMLNPMAMYDAGFVLSFASVAALMGLVRPLPQDATPTAARPGWVRRWAAKAMTYLRASWRVSVAATCVTAPITAYLFNSVSWVAPVVNIMAVPIGSLVATPAALLAAVVAPDDGIWQRVCMWPLKAALSALEGMAQGIGDRRWAQLDVPTCTPWELASFIVAVAALYAWPKHRRRAACWGLAACIVLVGCIGWRAHDRSGDGCMWVRHIYVGQGDATLVTLPKGGTVLVDGGGSIRDMGPDPGRNAVAPTLKRLNVRSIDWMVLTHPHPDHINGLFHIAKRWRVRHLLLAGGGSDYGSVRALQRRVEQGGGKVVRLRDLPEQLDWEGVQVTLPHPRRDGEDVVPKWHLNDNSLVMHLRHGARDILLAGDIEKRAEAALVKRRVTADILKVGHHGSRTSSTLPFLQVLHPHTAVISCGDDNQFGFPHSEALQRLSITGTRVLRTDAEGSITLRTDGEAWFVSTVQHPAEQKLHQDPQGSTFEPKHATWKNQ